uniref:Uncharacterized protein n=1 Tax=Mola mola TaxID=94237 RepID=A0A3Q4BUC3_MOLML
MVSVQEPEVQFAQRLASNDKSVRTRAMKVLRKYIRARSHKAAGGFTSDDLLRVWKGLFYCLWMQDKPLLQEELSRQISSLIHSFQDLLFLESFLQTFKREWTGIDRLRMDKFYQLVRFMFRQTFDMLRKKDWESSVVSRFLELLTAQLLQSASGAPSGLQIHILDLYMTELTALAAAEVHRTLFGAICSSIFSTIIDQAPFAIEDLIAEMKAAEASESEDDEDEEDDKRGEPAMRSDGNKGARKQINGKKSGEVEDESDTEAPCADDVGPVLQFDYGALADKLFELASRSSTPSHNRHRLYKIIKVLRDLSEGVFPQDEYPEEVSTDEDDDMFGSRKRMKRRRAGEEEEEASLGGLDVADQTFRHAVL